MSKKHICRQCQRVYTYCRGCLLSPILYYEHGFCSKTCEDMYNNKIKEVVPLEDVEVVVIDEDTSTPTEEAIECPYFFTATEIEDDDKEEENEEDGYIENYGEEIRSERCDISDEPNSVPEIL